MLGLLCASCVILRRTDSSEVLKDGLERCAKAFHSTESVPFSLPTSVLVDVERSEEACRVGWDDLRLLLVREDQIEVSYLTEVPSPDISP